MKAFKGSKNQRGQAEQMFLLFLWAVGIFIATTILVPAGIAIWRRSTGWGLAAVAILVGWTYLFVTRIVIPGKREDLRIAWVNSAAASCAKELAVLQPEFRTEGVLDSSGVLRTDWIVPMLTERRLRYIEVRGSNQSPFLITRAPHHGDESERLSWTHAPTPWVRIRLAREGDPSCVVVPQRLKDELQKTPFASNTCLALDAVLEPSAALEVQLIKPADEVNKVHGLWAVVDRATGKILAQLTTVDSAGKASTASRLLSKDEGRANDGSHIPAQMLFERIYGSDARPSSEQVFARQMVQTDDAPETLSLKQDRFTPVQADVSVRVLTSEQADLMRWPSWAAALEAARVVGVGGFMELHINAAKRELFQLEFGKSSRPNRWQVLGDVRGFFAFEMYPNSAESREQMLIHYDLAGRVDRAFRIQLGEGTLWRRGQVSTIRIEDGWLLIEGGPTGRSEAMWQVEVLRFRLPR
jgi:hypothetical protein